MEYTIVKDYRKNDTLRHSLNKLTNATFGFDFENWYANGYWNENYIPYSTLVNGEVVANVSVNIMNFNVNGEKKFYIQLGTVMTDENYRNKGFIRVLMNKVEKDYGDKVDGMFLFANDEVVEFYPKFGFVKANESQYVKNVDLKNDMTAEKITMNDKNAWDSLKAIIDSSAVNCAFEMVENSDLILFYITSFMQESVYYIKSLDTYVIADVDGDELLIYNILAKDVIDINDVINAFGKEIKNVKSGFTPLNVEGFTKTELVEDDTTLFVKGAGFHNFSNEDKMFPLLSHA